MGCMSIIDCISILTTNKKYENLENSSIINKMWEVERERERERKRKEYGSDFEAILEGGDMERKIYKLSVLFIFQNYLGLFDIGANNLGK